MSEPLIIDRTFITVPVDDDVQRAVNGWVFEHVDDLNVWLEPFGLTAGDIAIPEWHRLVYAEEVTNRTMGSQK